MTINEVVQRSAWSKTVVYDEIKKGYLKPRKIKMAKYTKYEVSEEEFDRWLKDKIERWNERFKDATD